MKERREMESFLKNQGFYDYINHFVTGLVFLFSMEILLSYIDISIIAESYGIIYNAVSVINDNEFMNNAFMLFYFGVLCFILGVFMQDVYDFFYGSSKIEKGKHFAETNEKSAHKVVKYFKCLSFFKRFYSKVRKMDFVKKIFADEKLIKNKFKREQYKKYAESIAEKKGIFPPNSIILNDELSEYFFAYCIYYLHVRNKDGKTEKLRDIEGLSEGFSMAFTILTVIAIFVAAYGFFEQILKGEDLIKYLMASTLCPFLSILFDYRTERAVKNRIRMTLALYEAEIDHAEVEH